VIGVEIERIAWRVSEFAEAIGVSRAKGYEIVAQHPELAANVGGSKRVLPERAREWLKRQSGAPLETAKSER